MQSTINSKLQDLESWFKDYDSVLIAFSGGVDSTLLAKAAFNSIGKKAVAVTADSPSIPRSELTNAKSLAQLIGIEHLVINTNEMENPDYVKNPSNRCYYCKSELFSTLSTLSKEKNIEIIVDGTNLDDLSDFRPGLTAANENQILHPFVDLKLTKNDIRNMSKHLQLPTADRPSAPCLSSRVVYGQPITLNTLSKIERAEALIKQLTGIEIIRVRDHNNIARIEVGRNERSLLFDELIMDKIDKELKNIGFKYITLELSGYKSGNLNK
mgnify:FL=1